LNEHGSLGSHLYRGPDDIRHRRTPWPSAVAKTEGFSLLPVVRMPVASCARRLLRACRNRYANPSPTSWRQFNQTPANRVFKPSALRKGLGCGEPFPLSAQSARCWHARATGNEATLANHPGTLEPPFARTFATGQEDERHACAISARGRVEAWPGATIEGDAAGPLSP